MKRPILISAFLSGFLLSAGLPGKSLPGVEPRVSLRATRISLRTLSARLTAAAGIHHAADAEVADLHVSLNVRGMPISAMRSRLAELMNLSWRTVTGESGEERLVLYRSAKNRAIEEQRVNEEERQFRRGVDMLLKVANLSDGEIDRLARQDWNLRGTLAQPGAREAIDLIAALPVAERERVIAGKALSFPIDRLPQQLEGRINSYLASSSPALTDAARAAGLAPTLVSIGRLGQGKHSCLYVGMELKGSNGAGGFATHLLSNGGTEASPVARESASESPESRYRIATSIRAATLDGALEALADQCDFPYIAESYAESGSGTRAVPAGEQTASQIISRLVLSNQTSRKSGSVWLIQRERWWDDRKSEISDELLAEIKQTLKNGARSLEDWSRLGALSLSQWPWIQTLRLGELNGLEHMLPALSLFHNMGTADRRAIFAGGLPSSRMRQPARSALVEWMKARGFEDQTELSEVLLTADVEEHGTRFTARVVYADGLQKICCQELLSLLPESALKQRVARSDSAGQ